MEWEVIWFFFRRFLMGFGIGIFIKFLLAAVFKIKSTFGGLIRTAVVFGIIYTLFTWWVVMRIGG